MLTSIIAAAVLGYLLGSLPFAVITSRLFGLADPRSYGSQNPGATNVLRSGNKLAALLTLLGDALKGTAAVLIAATISHHNPLILAIAGFCAFLGHLFPLFLGFKGGKGVSTAAGVLIAMSPMLGGATLIIWIATAKLSRYSSLAALSAAACAPLISAWLFGIDSRFIAVALMSALLIWRHRENIKRLLAGTESRLGKKNVQP